MRRFDRQPPPPVWEDFEERWLAEVALALTTGAAMPVAKKLWHSWKRDKLKAHSWFLANVTPETRPETCVYCDGEFDTSPVSIDHFVPESACPILGFHWWNLYPSCSMCNSGQKGARWSRLALRPDVDPVEEWLDIDPETGVILPAIEVVDDPRIIARIFVTVNLYGLNLAVRCKARLRVWKQMVRELPRMSVQEQVELIAESPYPFVRQRALRALVE